MAFGAAVIAFLAMTVPPLVGYERYVITGRSMEPTIERGSLIFSDVVPVGDLRRGDVITYVPPGGARLVTHRIVSIDRQAGQRPVMVTKGDGNVIADPWRFVLDESHQARVRAEIPLLGWPLIALSDRRLRIIGLALPAAVIALWTLVGLWREGGRLVAEREHQDVAVS